MPRDARDAALESLLLEEHADEYEIEGDEE